jgi:hypothetical protein
MQPEILKTKPWEDGKAPNELYVPKGMVGPEERRCYYWLAKNWLSGRGHIVDAGAFLGSSTYCFANGAAAGGRREYGGEPLIHAFDYFKVVDQYVGESITRDFRPIADGESYLDIFEGQTADYRDMIKTYAGNFLDHRWSGRPIEILFIDIAKTAELNAHAIGEFFGSLVPGQSALIHQDYFHCWHPYIHASMEYFDDEFELVDEHVPHQSRVWRLKKAIPKEKIARLAQNSLTKEERLALFDRLVAKSSDFSRPMIELAKIWQIYQDRDRERAREEILKFQDRYKIDDRNVLWAVQARQVRAHIIPGG